MSQLSISAREDRFKLIFNQAAFYILALEKQGDLERQQLQQLSHLVREFFPHKTPLISSLERVYHQAPNRASFTINNCYYRHVRLPRSNLVDTVKILIDFRKKYLIDQWCLRNGFSHRVYNFTYALKNACQLTLLADLQDEAAKEECEEFDANFQKCSLHVLEHTSSVDNLLFFLWNQKHLWAKKIIPYPAPLVPYTPKEEEQFLKEGMKEILLQLGYHDDTPITPFEIALHTWVWAGFPKENRLEVRCRIRSAYQWGSDFLDLSGLDLRDLPEAIGYLTHLRVLDVRNNSLVVLPDTIACLPQLSLLRISGNGPALTRNILRTFSSCWKIEGALKIEGGEASFPEHFLNFQLLAAVLKKLLIRPPFQKVDQVECVTMLRNRTTAELFSFSRFFLALSHVYEQVCPHTLEAVQKILQEMVKDGPVLDKVIAELSDFPSCPEDKVVFRYLLKFQYLSDPLFEGPLVRWSQEGTLSEGRDEAMKRMRHARCYGETALDLSRLNLRSLPPSLGCLSLKRLNLSRNALETLPLDMLARSELKDLDLSGNPPSLHTSEVLWNLPILWDLGVISCRLPSCHQIPEKVLRFQFLRTDLWDLYDQGLPPHFPKEALAKVLREREPHELDALSRLFRSLNKLQKHSQSPQKVLRRFEKIVQGFVKSPLFLNEALIDLAAREVACVDETALTLSQIEVLRLIHCHAPQADLKGLAEILIGLHRLELVDSWAMIRSLQTRNSHPKRGRLLDLRHELKARLSRKSEALEGALALRFHLREKLKLPITIDHVQFSRVATGEIGDLEFAADVCGREVLSFTTHSEDLLPLLMQNEQWKKRLAREVEGKWIALQERAPFSKFHDFFLKFHDKDLNHKKKVAPLKGTNISTRTGFFCKLKSLFDLQMEVMQEIEWLRHQFLCDQTYYVLVTLGFKPCDLRRLNELYTSLYEKEISDKQRRREHRAAEPEELDEKENI